MGPLGPAIIAARSATRLHHKTTPHAVLAKFGHAGPDRRPQVRVAAAIKVATIMGGAR